MAQRTAENNRGKGTAGKQHTGLIVDVTGELESVYVGKKYAYATVKVYQRNGYYMCIGVRCSLDFDFVEDGQTQTFKCEVTKYQDTYNFTEVNCK